MKRHLSLAGALGLLLLPGVSLTLLAAATPPAGGAQATGVLAASAPLPAGPVIAASAWFTDVAVERNAAAPGYGTGAAWGDYDADGDLDLYVVNLGPGGGGQANVLLRNDGAAFTDVSSAAGVGNPGPGVAAAWADYDNDGWLDLFVSNRPGANALYHNDGAGAFLDVAAAAGVDDPVGMGEGVGWADDDRDGLVDLYVANYSSVGGQPNRLFRNLDGVYFLDVASQRLVAHMGNGEGIAWADFDRDGDQDLYVANAGGLNALFQRQDDGTFANVTAAMHVPGGPGSSYGAAWGDYDNDGWPDLYVAQQGANKLYRNQAGADFDDVTAEAGVGGDRWSLGCAWADFDNDGDLDLHVANAAVGGYDPADVLYRNEGGSPVTFADVTAQAGVTNTLDARGSAWADFDGDGDLDLYVVNQGAGQPNRLFRNDGTSNGWLEVRLVGHFSNRSAIGARVTITAAGSQVREVSGGSGFGSQDSLPVEFGLGAWEGPVEVRVDWPSGLHSPLAGVAEGRAITLTELPDLSGAAKLVSAEEALPGAALTYTLSLPNSGGLAALARLTDTLPLGLTWGGAMTATAGTPVWDPEGKRLLWSGAIGPWTAVAVTYRATVEAGLPPGIIITNTATLADGYQPPFDVSPVTVTVLCRALSGVGFSYAPAAPVAGEPVTFTVTATGSLPITFGWDWGDGETGAGAVAAHTYASPGEFDVILTAANPCGQEVVAQAVAVAPPTRWVYLPLVLRARP